MALIKKNWRIWLVGGSILPLAWMALNVIKFLSLERTTGLVDTTTEQAVFFIGRYLALPYGLLTIIISINALKKGLLKKSIAIMGIISGILNLLVGLVMWIAFVVVMAFAAAF